MIKLAIVAGDKAEKLATFMKERGTFDVPFQYSTLTENLSKIQNQIVKVDKLLYIYQGGNAIRQEMQTLRQLLQGSGFFAAKEFIMMGTRSEETEIAFRYFKTVMQDCGKDNFVTKEIDGVMSYAVIYENLLGFTKIDSGANKYKTLYRVERGSDVKKVFDGKDSFKMSVEPFSFSNVEVYQEKVALAKKTDAGLRVTEVESSGPQYTRPVLGQIEATEVVGKAKTFLVTGKAKTGKSVWASALAVSMQSDDKRVLVLDYTETTDVYDLLRADDKPAKEVRMIDMMRKQRTPEGIEVCMPEGSAEVEVRWQLMQHLYATEAMGYDFVVLVVELEDMEKTLSLLGSRVSEVVLCTTLVQKDVIALQRFMTLLSERSVTVVTNEYQSVGSPITLPVDGVKLFLPFAKGVVKPVTFTTFPQKPTVYKSFQKEVAHE